MAASSVASTVDYQIAAAVRQNRCYLLTADKDFVRMARIFPLKLV